ncbi:DUF4919 domain-containing protein [Candidatus Eisenbacteria bacterium]|uniref:DUF4919 domain-containing protein n=1 Tax=Eiseniibacteriota bacterium TaxID=2212470 RepID=A0ABV6YMX8_UNCEI
MTESALLIVLYPLWKLVQKVRSPHRRVLREMGSILSDRTMRAILLGLIVLLLVLSPILLPGLLRGSSGLDPDGPGWYTYFWLVRMWILVAGAVGVAIAAVIDQGRVFFDPKIRTTYIAREIKDAREGIVDIADEPGPEANGNPFDGPAGDVPEKCPCMEGLQIAKDGSFENPFHYAGGDGSSVEQAVVVLGIDVVMVFIRGIHLWIHQRYPGWQILDRLPHKGVRMIATEEDRYCAVTIQGPFGERGEVFFNDTVMVAACNAESDVYRAAGPKAAYDQILKRLESGNLAVNFARLRASFTETENYDPDDRELDRLAFSVNEAMYEDDWRGALRAAGRFLQKCMACPAVHAMAADAHHFLGQDEQCKFHAAVAGGLYTAMQASGDGSSEESALKVLYIFEEYQFLGMQGLRVGGQALREIEGRAFDVMSVSASDEPEEREFYFDVTWLVDARKRRYCWGRPSDEDDTGGVG